MKLRIPTLFVPILAGATLSERAIACLGSLIGITFTGIVTSLVLGGGWHLPVIIAPMGASAVLIFAVPASPLAQPWPVIGGNIISTLIGMGVAQLVPEPAAAMGLGVSLAIAVMSLTRCLHPPGGAAALTAVIGGPALSAAGYLFAFVPVGINSVVLVLLGVLFHRASGRSYPHKPAAVAMANAHQTADPPSQLRVGFRPEDVDAALETMHETFDIDRKDLDSLLREVRQQALLRSHADLRCADIMSRDVVCAGPEATPEEARALLIRHEIRTVVVTDADGRLIGTVGLRELTTLADRIGQVVAAATTVEPYQPVLGLMPVLTGGQAHAVVVLDPDQRVIGLITQTDLLAVAATLIPSA
jgi:CBS domain-containing membrane protein